MPDVNPLSRTRRPPVSPEAEALILGTPAPAPEPVVAVGTQETPGPELVEAQARRAGKGSAKESSNVELLAAGLGPKETTIPVTVAIPKSLDDLVTEKVGLARAKRIKLTKNGVYADALKLYFGIK